MGWGLGFDNNWNRWIGYEVPAYCDHPKCKAKIDRGLSYVCCKQQPHGGEDGCGLYFCNKHSDGDGKCKRCANGKEPFKPKPEHPTWMKHLLTHSTWEEWREENPKEVEKFKRLLK
jgi:hypothetical protein